MKRRMICMIMVLSLLLCPAASFANTYDTIGPSEEIKSFDVNGLTYYDVYNGITEGRDTGVDALIDAALYGKKDGEDHSAARYWADFAYGVYKSTENKKGYWLAGESFGTRFDNDVKYDQEHYGNMVDGLSSRAGKVMYSDEDSKFDRSNDINTKFSGKQSAKNLNQVLGNAFDSLAALNKGELKASDFKKYHDLKALSNDTGDGKVVYNMMTTIDRDGWTQRRTYNCFVIAYSNFAVTPVSGKDGEGITTALENAGYQNLNEAIKEVSSGTSIAGFSLKEDGNEIIKGSLTNTKKDPASQTLNTEWNKTETLSSTISHEKEIGFSQGQTATFSFGKEKSFFKSALEFSFTEEELYRDGVSETNETTKSDTGGVSQTIEIPGHTKVEQYTINKKPVITMAYDCPVELSYTVTIFSLCGEFYDDNVLTSYLATAGYEQGSFMTQYGNGKKSACQNLKERVEHTGDTGYDQANGLTRGTKVWHAHSGYSWENPWVNHIDYNQVKSNMRGSKPEERQQLYDNVTGFLTKNRPISINGATLKRSAVSSEGFIGEATPIYPLETVDLIEDSDEMQSIDAGGSLNLSGVKLQGIDSEECDFYGFSDKKGEWKIVDADEDENGNVKVLKESKVISLTKDKKGKFIVKGLSEGTAYVQYFVNEKAYKLSNGKYVKPEDVETPVIEVTVTEKASKGTEGKQTEKQTSEEKTNASDDSSENQDIADDGAGVEISQAEEEHIMSALDCDDQYCSVAEAALFVKDHVGAASSLNEQMYTKALLQMASDKISNNDTHAQMEIEAVVWAQDEDLFAHMHDDILAAHGGITALEFAQLAYNAAVKFGMDVSCDNVIEEYAGAENLDKNEKDAVNWAISKGLLSDKEESEKTLELDRLMTTAEVSDFFR